MIEVDKKKFFDSFKDINGTQHGCLYTHLKWEVKDRFGNLLAYSEKSEKTGEEKFYIK